jgi:hypothetical protein
LSREDKCRLFQLIIKKRDQDLKIYNLLLIQKKLVHDMVLGLLKMEVQRNNEQVVQ